MPVVEERVDIDLGVGHHRRRNRKLDRAFAQVAIDQRGRVGRLDMESQARVFKRQPVDDLRDEAGRAGFGAADAQVPGRVARE